MKKLLFLLLCLGQAAWAQVPANTKVSVLTAKLAAKNYPEGFDQYEVTLKLVSGAVADRQMLALALPNGTARYAYLDLFGQTLAAGKTTAPCAVHVAGGEIKAGQTLVAPETIKAPAQRTFGFKTGTMFVDGPPGTYFGQISGFTGVAQVGDELDYTNDRGQKGRAKIVGFKIGYLEPKILFAGLADNQVSIQVLASPAQVDFSNSTAKPASGAAPVAGPQTAGNQPKASGKVKPIMVNKVLENAEVKITVHRLIKYNPDPADSTYDIFKVDYSMDYYIVDATVENKTDRELDASDYLLRFNFFTPDGQSADEFTRLFKSGNSTDAAKQDADKVDVNIFGGTGKIKLAQVLAKYSYHLPDYEKVHRPATDALMTKKLKPRQVLRAEAATPMGVPPSYRIQGLGTWGGTFFSKKNLLFVALSL
jgi:hypothetical protein